MSMSRRTMLQSGLAMGAVLATRRQAAAQHAGHTMPAPTPGQPPAPMPGMPGMDMPSVPVPVPSHVAPKAQRQIRGQR